MASSIAWRVFAGTSAVVGLVVVAALILASTAARRTADASARRGLEQAADLVAQLLSGRERSMAGGARVFVQAPYFRTLVAERGRDDILDQTFEAVEQLEAEWVFITDERGTLLAKSDEPSAAGDALGSVALVSNALRGQISGGFGVSGDSLLFQATAVPIALPDMAPLGVLVATRVVDSTLTRDLRAATASDVVFYVVDRAGAPHVVVSTLPQTSEIASAMASLLPGPMPNAESQRDLAIGGTEWLSQSTALTTAGGEVVGGFLVLRPQDTALATLSGVRRSLAAAALFGFLLALLAGWLTARSVTRPVRVLSHALLQAAEGNYETSPSGPLTDIVDHGEIGALARAVNALFLDLRDRDALGASTTSYTTDAVIETSLVSTAAATGGSVVRRVRPLTSLPAPAGLKQGDMLANRYRIEGVLGSGGMGMVYKAHDRALGEMIALKLLQPDIIAGDAQVWEHLRDELRLARRITHRNVVRIHDIGESDGVPFLTMEFVDGTSLQSVIQTRGSLPVPAVLSLGRQLMRALSAAHEADIVHADVKPANILVGPNGVVKVTDFGVAHVVRSAQRVYRETSRTDSGVSGRLAGAVVGTPQYLAPELLIGGPPSVAGDLYAAGVVLHECLIGTTPYAADTPVAFIASKLSAETAPTIARSATVARASTNESIPTALSALIHRLLDSEATRRPRSAADVHESLMQIR